MSFRFDWPALSVALILSSYAFAQNADFKNPPPVLDVHVHAMDADFPGIAPMCPNTSKFIASDPKTKEDGNGWVKENLARRRCIQRRRAST